MLSLLHSSSESISTLSSFSRSSKILLKDLSVSLLPHNRSSRPEMFSKKKRLFLIRLQASRSEFFSKETSAQVFSCEFCEIFKNTFFYRQLVAAFNTTCHSKSFKNFVHFHHDVNLFSTCFRETKDFVEFLDHFLSYQLCSRADLLQLFFSSENLVRVTTLSRKSYAKV